MKRTKSIVVTVLIIVYLLGILPRQAVLAQEVPPLDSQSESTEPSPSPDPNVNQQVEPSPSPSPDPCVSDCPPTEVDQTNDAVIDNQVTDVANTGDNTIEPSPSPSPEPEGDSSSTDPAAQGSGETDDQNAAIETGDAVSDVDMVTVANTNLVNAEITYHIENIYIDENGDIDLSKSESYETQSSVNLEITQQNQAVVNNVVTAIANSGANTINGSSGDITTGTATVVVNIFNFINANFVNSVWQFVVINIFGNVQGNIILPELGEEELSLLGTVSGDVSQENSAEVENTIDASANTGENQVSGSGSIETGDATSVVNNQNFVNFNLLGGVYYMLLVNNFGNWDGQFLGWGSLSAATPVWGQMLFMPYFNLQIDENGVLVAADQTNNAQLNNQITASANTGGNLIDGNGQIITGNAYSAVNLINFVNTNVVNSVGFFGIINIFGSLTGNIGGESFFAASQSTEATESTENGDQEEVRVAGGQLETSMATNVATHVNPGDTATFFITARNPGSGPVYDAKVYFNLYDSNGEIATIQSFDLGKLEAGQTAKISFGVVLAGTAPAGLYEALVEAQGKVGPDNQGISSQAQTGFRVGAGSFGSLVGSFGNPDVEAASTAAGGTGGEISGAQATNYWWWIYSGFGMIGMAYVLYRVSRLSPRYYQILVAYGRRRRINRVSVAFSKFASKATAFRSWFFEL